MLSQLQTTWHSLREAARGSEVSAGHRRILSAWSRAGSGLAYQCVQPIRFCGVADSSPALSSQMTLAVSLTVAYFVMRCGTTVECVVCDDGTLRCAPSPAQDEMTSTHLIFLVLSRWLSGSDMSKKRIEEKAPQDPLEKDHVYNKAELSKVRPFTRACLSTRAPLRMNVDSRYSARRSLDWLEKWAACLVCCRDS